MVSGRSVLMAACIISVERRRPARPGRIRRAGTRRCEARHFDFWQGWYMIDLYYWTTPNGHKITMFLEETGLPYRIVPVDIGSGAQFEPTFLAISPNNRIPAIVDHAPADSGAPLSVFESGAILMYLAEKSGGLLPRQLRARVEVTQWLFWQMAGLGPM